MAAPIFIALTILYLIFTLVLWYGWRSLEQPNKTGNPKVAVSVIIAVRNEEDNILNLLDDLKNQSYPRHLYEVIVVDDHSDDETFKKITAFKRKGDIAISLLRLKNTSSAPKKAAINLAVSQAGGDLIMVTDGDCRVGKYWIRNIAYVFETKKARFIAGPVAFYEETTFISKLLSIEFSSLVGSGAALLYFKRPVMCNAANLAFDKKTFFEVKGFEGNERNASGDDVFLMRKIFDLYPEQVVFIKDEATLVTTFSEKRFVKFYNQRIRWASKWRMVRGIENKLVPVFIFLFHLSFFAALVFFILEKLSLLNLFIIVFTRFTGEYLFLRDVMRFSKRNAPAIHYFVASLLYPFYAVTIGIMANFDGYYWKGRKYK